MKPLTFPEDNAALNGLLKKTRRVGRAFQTKRKGEPLNYYHLAQMLSDFSTANAYIVDQSGRLLGYHWLPDYTSKALSESFREGVMPDEFVRRMNKYRDTEIGSRTSRSASLQTTTPSPSDLRPETSTLS